MSENYNLKTNVPDDLKNNPNLTIKETILPDYQLYKNNYQPGFLSCIYSKLTSFLIGNSL